MMIDRSVGRLLPAERVKLRSSPVHGSRHEMLGVVLQRFTGSSVTP